LWYGNGAGAALVRNTAKQRAEAANFEAFKLAHPNFAGRPLVSSQWGGDPPDVLCLDATLVSEIPFESGQIVCRDAVDAKTLEVMSYAAKFPDSLVGHAPSVDAA
jgi:hypothetical protein